MSKNPAFSSKDLERVLHNLGFTIDKSKGKGGHYKAKCPPNIKIQPGQKSFVIIPHTKEIYEDLRNKIIREVKSFGFTEEQFLEALNK